MKICVIPTKQTDWIIENLHNLPEAGQMCVKKTAPTGAAFANKASTQVKSG